MDDISEFNATLQTALTQKHNWFNSVCLQSVLGEYRLLYTCVKNLNEMLIKKSLIVPDPYKFDKRISDIVVPETAVFPDNEVANILGARISDYEVMLDFICTYFSFTVENISIPTIKKLLEFNKVFDWKNISSNSASCNTRNLANLLSSAKKNAPGVIISMINDSCSKSAESIEKINSGLNELGIFQRELYKGELRQDVFNHPDFSKEKAFSSPENEMAEIKRLFSKVIGKRKPFYNELIGELIAEDQGDDKQKAREAVLKRLEVKNASATVTKKKKEGPNAHKMLMDTTFCFGAIAPTLQQIHGKLQENFDIVFEAKKGFGPMLAAMLKKAFRVPEKEKVCNVNIVESSGRTRQEKVRVSELFANINQKIRIYGGIAVKGNEYQKIDAADETAILNFVNKQISECQSLFSVLNALDSYFKSTVDPIKKAKIKGLSLELSTLRSSIVNVNKKRGEFISFKEEAEQMKRLGIKDEE